MLTAIGLKVTISTMAGRLIHADRSELARVINKTFNPAQKGKKNCEEGNSHSGFESVQHKGKSAENRKGRRESLRTLSPRLRM